MGNYVPPPAPPSIPPEHPFLSVSLLAAFRFRVPFRKRYSSRFRSARSSAHRMGHAHWLARSAKASRTGPELVLWQSRIWGKSFEKLPANKKFPMHINKGQGYMDS